MVVTLCGSLRFEKAFKEWNERLSLAGHVVFTVTVYPSDKTDGKDWYTDEQKANLDHIHKRKIDHSDAILVLNEGGYVGDSTRSEIDHARSIGRRVYALELVPPVAITGRPVCRSKTCRDPLTPRSCPQCPDSLS